MPATADNLRDLHLLHQRAKALRDRLASGPKTLAARQAALASRRPELEHAKKALQDAKVQLKKHEHSLQGIETKIDDLKVKLNQVKKNEEYKALQNQIAHENAAKSKIEEEILVSLRSHRNQDRRARKARSRGETVQRDEVAALQQQIDKRSRSPQGPARGTGDGDRPGRERDPRRIPGNTAASWYVTAPMRWPRARKARAWAVSPRSRRRWSTTSSTARAFPSA